MKEQQIFFKDNHGTIHIHNSPSIKKDDSQNVKMTSDLKNWLVQTSSIISEATGDTKYGASTLASEAIEFYRTFFSIRKKILKYKNAVVELVKNLP